MTNQESLQYLAGLAQQLESTVDRSLTVVTEANEYSIYAAVDGVTIIMPETDSELVIHYKVTADEIQAVTSIEGNQYLVTITENGMLNFGGERPPHPEVMAPMVTNIDKHMAELSAEAAVIQRLETQVMSSLAAAPMIENDPGEEKARDRNKDLASAPDLTENVGEAEALDRARTLRMVLGNVAVVKRILREYSEHQAHLALVNNGLLPSYDDVALTDLPVMSFSDIDQLKIEKEFSITPWNHNKTRRLLVSKDVTEPTILLYQSALDDGAKPFGGAMMLPHNFDSVVVPHESAFHFKLGKAMFGDIAVDDSALLLKQKKGIGVGGADILVKDETTQQEWKTEHARQRMESLAPILNRAVAELAEVTGLAETEVLNRLDYVELEPDAKRDHLHDLGL